MQSTEARERYLATAREALREATLEDLLSFLSVRRIVGGTATAAFYNAFPGGRGELIEELRAEAAPARVGSATPVTVETVSGAMQLIANVGDGDRDSLEKLLEVGLANLTRHLDDAVGESAEVLRGMMAAVARVDEDARDQLRGFYEALIHEYAGLFRAILTALGREPIEEFDSIRGLTLVIAAMHDGLGVRERVGQPGEAALAIALLPVVVALTKRTDEDQEDPIEVLLPASPSARGGGN